MRDVDWGFWAFSAVMATIVAPLIVYVARLWLHLLLLALHAAI